MSGDIEAVLRKVRALRELAQSANVHEAEAAAARADALIQKYRLEEAQLEVDGAAVAERISDEAEPLEESKTRVTWRGRLAYGLALHYDCSTFWGAWTADRYSALRIVGRPSDVASVRYMYAWLVVEIARLALNSTRGEGRHAAHAFRLGAVRGFREALRESAVEAQEEHKSANGGQASMVLADRAVEIGAWMGEHHPSVVFRAESMRVNSDAYDRGRVAGNNIHVGKALGAAGGRLLTS